MFSILPQAKPAAVTTNADGRSDGPLLEGVAFLQGHYELRFPAGEYRTERLVLEAFDHSERGGLK